MSDQLIKATLEGGVRLYILSAAELVETARSRHNTSPVATAALGRTMMGALLLAATMKNSEAITIKISGDGLLGNIVADACGGNVRGYVDNPVVELPLTPSGKLAVGAAVGPDNGNISVTRFAEGKEPFTGICNLATGEIAEDLTRYLYVSEQTPSSVALGVFIGPDGRVQNAGGFFVQPMPDAAETTLEQLGENISQLPSITTLLGTGKSLEEIAAMIAGKLQVNYYETVALRFACQCSQERIYNTLATLSKAELEDLAKQDSTEIVCHFCNEKYLISRNELQSIIAAQNND